ncbi:hypothetical protein OH492_12275 [Vibrio chagasii]|nr:hypothetical protein [Vibrio chagasii]
MVQTTAAVICGEKDVQLRTFDLPKISDDELLVKNVSNSICLSTYKAARSSAVTTNVCLKILLKYL